MKKQKQNQWGRQRKFTTDNFFAGNGFFAAEVQKVIKRWKGKLGEDICRHYFPMCSSDVSIGRKIEIPLLDQAHMRFVLELMLALHDFYSDESSPGSAMVRYGQGGSKYDPKTGHPQPRIYEEIRHLAHGTLRKEKPEIRTANDNKFAQTAKRLRLTK